MIHIRHLTKTYGKRHNKFAAIKDISFDVPEGTSVAILGKSGSGKSTLMHAISGLDRPERGEVVIGEKDILRLRGRKLDRFRSREMGFIFQSFFVEGNETCYHNVSLPLEIVRFRMRKRRKLIHEALEKVDLSDKLHAKARNLSGGQKQRLAIARAIVNSPKIIFADEPTGNLDSVTGERIIDLLFNLNRELGSTLFIVTHDEDLARKCTMRINIKDGEVLSIEGNPKADPTEPITVEKRKRRVIHASA
jgi:putative ABC transport system ATP-binding protein